MTKIKEFKKKYGSKTLSLLIEEFIKASPEFEGDSDLAKVIAPILVDLEAALEEINIA